MPNDKGEYNEAEIHRIIREEIDSKGLRVTARRLGVSAAYLSDIRWRRRGISAKIAAKFGFSREKIINYFFKKASK